MGAMSGSAARRKARSPLTRERVLQAALRLADQGGVEALSMRTLGQELGVEAMSLYNHVRNKDDVLDGLVDIVFGEIDVPCETRDWKAAMRGRARSAREVLARHRWAIPLMESRTQAGPQNLRHHDSVLRCLRESGFSVQMAAHAYSLIDSYIYGFALEQANLPFDTGPEAAELAETLMKQFADSYPYLAEITTELIMKPGYSYSAEFEFGLEAVLDGLERALKPRRRPRSAPLVADAGPGTR